MEIHTGTKTERGEEVGRNRPSLSASPSSLLVYRTLSLLTAHHLQLQRIQKGGSNINRQKYTELIFTCLLDVRKLSYTHTKKVQNKKKKER